MGVGEEGPLKKDDLPQAPPRPDGGCCLCGSADQRETRCRGVQADLALIKTLRAGSTLDLVEGEGLAMELRSLPKITRSGGFSLAFLLADGGEANIVIGTSGSMFGSIKP